MIRTVYVSDVGHVRSVNEDSSWVAPLEQGYTLGIVADGMGGHRAGDTASRLAVETIVKDLSAIPAALSLEDCGKAVQDAILHANQVIYQAASQSEEYHNMGTTVVVLLLAQDKGVLGHIGDSRAYKYRDGQLFQLTEDHTLVNELVKNGQISQEEAGMHPRRNVLTRALGTDEKVAVDLNSIEFSEGDLFLLCSDGLSSYVSTDRMVQILGTAGGSLQSRAESLLQLALDAGGDDNITVVLMERQADSAGLGIKEWKS